MIKHSDLSKLAYHELKKRILKGNLAKGQKLVQEKIAAELGISRMPLHKALQMLESEFLIESIPRKGYFVKEHNLKDKIDAFECREVLEGLAARKLAKNVDHEKIADKLASFFKPYLNNSDINNESYRKADQDFHNTICELSNNTVLQKMDALANYLQMTFTYGLLRTPEETLPEHMEIIEAIREGNGEKAELLMRKHATITIDKLEKELKA
ncbi:GntR family transcriptional regulator [uncultured Arcticibacterium sp.]|uniref:GntR family transcriptional regulator n=1 Tax=uncultured Arcticibacterium sp. TaxID=2173042 RepID=UPI0030FA07CB